MRNLRKFLRLPRLERHLLFVSIILLWASRLGLWLLPFQALRHFLWKVALSTRTITPTSSVRPDKIAWAVSTASRCVPAATCLTQALAGEVLLVQHGEPAVLRIGVIKNEAGNLKAHAWVESRGRIMIGDSRDLFRYTPLPPVQWGVL